MLWLQFERHQPENGVIRHKIRPMFKRMVVCINKKQNNFFVSMQNRTWAEGILFSSSDCRVAAIE